MFLLDKIPMISSSILRGKAIYEDMLAPHGYSSALINDIVISEFLNYERSQLGESTSLFLLSIKKVLLYAIPIVADVNGRNKRGVPLTAQFSSDVLALNGAKRVDRLRLESGDKYTLIGLFFPPELVNNLSIDIFDQKYYYRYPEEYEHASLDISYIPGISAETRKLDNKLISIYLIDQARYEDVNMYNHILRAICAKLFMRTTEWSSIMYQVDQTKHEDTIKFAELHTMKPLNMQDYLPKLNALLEDAIDPTFTISYYNTLHKHGHWRLYNDIFLYTFGSPRVEQYLKNLDYVKSENTKIRDRTMKQLQKDLLATRAEKIAREQYPFYFSSTDKRGIFTRFMRFSLKFISKEHQKEVEILLKKDLSRQDALIHNKCDHIVAVKHLLSSESIRESMLKAFAQVEPFLGSLNEEHVHKCNICKYAVLCEHESDFYKELKLNFSADTDQIYKVQQIIINRYKKTQMNIDHSDVFSYQCKYCSKELGKSTDAIQVNIKSVSFASPHDSDDPIRGIVFMTIRNVIRSMVDPLALGFNDKQLMNMIFPIVDDQVRLIVDAMRKRFKINMLADITPEMENNAMLSAMVFTICTIIALNHNILKTDKSVIKPVKMYVSDSAKSKPKSKSEPTPIEADSETDASSEEESPIEDISDPDVGAAEIIEGGFSIKDEFKTAFLNIKSSKIYEQVLPSDDKLKTMLLEYYRLISINLGKSVDIQSLRRTADQRLSAEIVQSPVYAYMQYAMARSAHKTIKKESFEQVMGYASKAMLSKDNLYESIPTMNPSKSSTDRAKYVEQSYNSIREFLTEKTFKGSSITKELSEFMRNYEARDRKRTKLHTENPKNVLQEATAREVSFLLRSLHIVYCSPSNNKLIRHNWKLSKGIVLCDNCGTKYADIDKIKSVGSEIKIQELIDDDLFKQSMFEYFLASCPIKDNHVYSDEKPSAQSKCDQCGFSKHQLLSHDDGFYKKYSSQYASYRDAILKSMISNAKNIIKSSQTPASDNAPIKVKLKTESEAKIAIAKDVITISSVLNISSEKLSMISEDKIDSHIRMIYERYMYIYNRSINMPKHADEEFYDFVRSKFFQGVNIVKLDLTDLDDYDYNEHPFIVKQAHLWNLILQMINQGPLLADLAKYLLSKIIAQETRCKEFNFAKLKAMSNYADQTEDDEEMIMDPDADAEEEDAFDGYDMDLEDIEDNIHGAID